MFQYSFSHPSIPDISKSSQSEYTIFNDRVTVEPGLGIVVNSTAFTVDSNSDCSRQFFRLLCNYHNTEQNTECFTKRVAALNTLCHGIADLYNDKARAHCAKKKQELKAVIRRQAYEANAKPTENTIDEEKIDGKAAEFSVTCEVLEEPFQFAKYLYIASLFNPDPQAKHSLSELLTMFFTGATCFVLGTWVAPAYFVSLGTNISPLSIIGFFSGIWASKEGLKSQYLQDWAINNAVNFIADKIDTFFTQDGEYIHTGKIIQFKTQTITKQPRANIIHV